jgi:protease-4
MGAEQAQPAPPGQPKPAGSGILALLVVLVVVLAFGLLVSWIAFALATQGKPGKLWARPCVALIKVEGVLAAGGAPSFLGSGGGLVDLLDQVRRAEEDEEVKAVVVWIDSPGGAAAAAQALYSRLRRLQSKKPVVAALGDVAASGGYYIAAAATKIVASPATLTGSIGVIFSTINVAELMKRFGVQDVTLTSGKYKDTGSAFRPMRPDEVELIKGLVKDIYEQFVADVAAGRRLPVAQVRRLADGRVFTGRQAKALGLVDELGTREDAIRLAAKLGGVEGWPEIKEYAPGPPWLRWLLQTAVPRQPWYALVLEKPGAWLTLPVPGASYWRWVPRGL